MARLVLVQLLLLSVLASVCTGQFQLVSPPSRGYDAATDTQYPCGGFNSSMPSTYYPTDGSGYMHVDVSVGYGEIDFLYSTDGSVGEWTFLSKSYGIGKGDTIIPITLEQISGQQVVLQLIYNATLGNNTHTRFYQCLDVYAGSASTLSSWLRYMLARWM